jgi:hypothetical protein
MLYSAVARSLRFIVLEGLLIYWFGEQAQAILDKYLELALIVFLVLVVAGVVLVGFVMK